MNKMQTITFSLLFSVLLVFGIVQQSMIVSFSPDSLSFFNFFNQQQPKNFEAAELERQANLNCGQ